MHVRGFVGRKRELLTLTDALSSTQLRVVNVAGIGGVGKSTLVSRFAQDAAARGHVVAVVNARRLTDPLLDHAYHPVIETLIALEAALAKSGCHTDSLKNRLRRYRHLHQQLTARFDAEQATAAASILQIGIGAIRAGAAVFPIAKPLEAILTPELASQVSKAIGSHRKPTDRELLARPVPYLTKFLNDILAQAGRRQRVLLIFDEYELSPMQIDAWLRGLLDSTYGTLDARVLLVLVGRDPLGQDWTARGQSGNLKRLQASNTQAFQPGRGDRISPAAHRSSPANTCPAHSGFSRLRLPDAFGTATSDGRAAVAR